MIVDFAGKIGLDLEGMELVRANESLSRDAMLFLNEMNRRIVTYGEHGRSLLRDGLLESAAHPQGDKFRADRPTAERIVERSAEDRAYLAETLVRRRRPLGEVMAGPSWPSSTPEAAARPPGTPDPRPRSTWPSTLPRR